jgi:hypothetical protein
LTTPTFASFVRICGHFDYSSYALALLEQPASQRLDFSSFDALSDNMQHENDIESERKQQPSV